MSGQAATSVRSTVSARGLPLGIPRSLGGRAGVLMVVVVVLVAFVGPLIAPHPPDRPVGIPGDGPNGTHLLGTDFLGRDVLSRVLDGGKTVLWLGGAATALTYMLALSIGLVAGYTRSWLDPVLMRSVDLVLSFPPLLLLLVLVSGAGSGKTVLICGTALVLFPGAARLVRAATLEVSVSGYVEAAAARGERTFAILWREILPNILHVVTTDLGIRCSAAIVLVASLNFLGVGLQPPTADWGLMITENRPILSSNLWAVLVPAAMLGTLTLGVNLTADAYLRSRGRATVDT